MILFEDLWSVETSPSTQLPTQWSQPFAMEISMCVCVCVCMCVQHACMGYPYIHTSTHRPMVDVATCK